MGVLTEKPLFSPTDFIEYVARLRKVPTKSFRLPKRLLLVYHSKAYEEAKRIIGGAGFQWIFDDSRPVCSGSLNGVKVGAAKILIGAPAAAMSLEEIIACGARKAVEVGLAGGLKQTLKPGEIIIASSAVSDEGTSRHYFPSQQHFKASPKLQNLLIDTINEMEIKPEVGPVWSTDGVYRETKKKLTAYRKKGALAVNMETSALYAVAKHRRIQLATVLVIPDVLSESGWRQAFQSKAVSSGLKLAVKAALKALRKS